MNLCGLWMTHLGEREKPAPVPLTGVGVHVRIADLVAEVKIEQINENNSSHPIEITYTFPLEEGAVVSQFTADIDGCKITEVIKETSETQADFLIAIHHEQATAMAQEENADVFTAKVGKIAAGKRAKIQLTYTTKLKVVSGERFAYPFTFLPITPIYIPVEDKPSATASLASTNHTGISSDYEFKFEAVITMTSAIIGIRSPTHPIFPSTFNDGMKATVVLSAIASPMDRNLVLYVSVDKPCYKSRWILQLGRMREAKQVMDASLALTNLLAAREAAIQGGIDMLKS